MKKHLVLSMVGLLGGLLFLPACTQDQKKKEIYLQLYSVRDDIKADYTGTIAQVAEMGYTGVEPAGYADGKFYGLTPAEFKKSIEDVGMEVLSSHTARPLNDDSIAATNWDEVWAWWDTAIQAHKEAGMNYIVFPWMNTPATLADLQAYCDYFNQIGERCNAAGLRFGYHNHDFEFKEIEGQLMYDYMLNNTDPSKVFFQMDVYWLGEGGKDPVEYFNNYPGRFELLHIKDELEIGQSGKVDFENIYNNAGTAGAKYMIVEVERYSEGLTPFESIKESIDFLNDAPYVKASYSK